MKTLGKWYESNMPTIINQGKLSVKERNSWTEDRHIDANKYQEMFEEVKKRALQKDSL